ncbi:MAG: Asp-tRNA(Asn)/Glu-tRNA(Gln) amidotransferase subunit GatA [Gammaproteobacteria bacterium]
MASEFPDTAAELAAGLAAGRFSSVELTRHYLARIERLDATLNSFITVCADRALAQAAAADTRRAAGTAGALDGVPYANKDIFCTNGVRTSCGSHMLDNFIAPYDAHVVERLHAAGLVMLGKTNMDEFAMGSSNETSYYGPVQNPWDRARVPGGSSGGSATAVAAGLAPLATGTDTGGSIRQPAALCGISGLKPTYGRVSRYGMIAFASSLDQGGPMARDAQDLALLLNAMAGFDPRDSTSVARADEDYTRAIGTSLDGLRVGLPREYFGADLDPRIGDTIHTAVAALEARGASVHEISLPNAALAIPAYYVIASAECSANLSRYDGVRFGYRCEEPRDLEDLYSRSRGEAFGEEVKRRILVGTYALSSGYYDAYYRKAQQLRRLIKQDFVDAFQTIDVIAGPTTPGVAFPAGTNVEDPVTMYLSDVYTTAVNLAGLPAISVPAGFVDNLPVGLQLIGNYFDEARLLGVAHAYQQDSDWHLRKPPGTD